MRILHFSFRSVRSKAIPAILAVLLYVLPSLVQEVHRLIGHHDNAHSVFFGKESGFQQQTDKCPICVFEFYTLDEIPLEYYSAVFSSSTIKFSINSNHQIALKIFDYFQLRAPPVS